MGLYTPGAKVPEMRDGLACRTLRTRGSVACVISIPSRSSTGTTRRFPSRCRRASPTGLRDERLDVALSPIFELIAHPGYLVVDDVAIASRGAVFSVFIAYAGDLDRLHTLYLDTDSRTSFNLQRVLLAEFHDLKPACEPLPGGRPPDVLKPGQGALVIGDPAIEFRLRHGDRYRYFDLGEEWQRATGLPFVFAAWLARPDTPEPEALGDRLRGWRAAGQARVEEIVSAERRFPAELSRRYLTNFIRFRLGEPEKQAIREFARLLYKHGVIKGGPFVEPRWV